ncbi:hypothetical protein Nepgr_032751 [Nepenthes gracilis]|uniref:Uncharacterized protein n=1 Tax=Nepenthes gracilis TaxID=150966 RepID=A0AAD3TL15_NEPGR|nr:hypothetical protein Nepgr_032751 [Nepenthes gracilis]
MAAHINRFSESSGFSHSVSLRSKSAGDGRRNNSKGMKASKQCNSVSIFSEILVPNYHLQLFTETEEEIVLAAAKILRTRNYHPPLPAEEIEEERLSKHFNSSHPKKIRTSLKRKSRPASDFGRIEKFRNCKAEELKQENNNCP